MKFEAISYVWGSNTGYHTILLNGNAHQITANLHDRLRQCRLPDQSRSLWADSICINQTNLEEKDQQVWLMGRIYAASQCTLICLGTDAHHRHHARNAAAILSRTYNMMSEVFQRPDFSWEPNSFPWPHLDDPLVQDSRWISVDILTELPWFYRGWVVQEAVLGRDARILWGGSEFPLLDLLRASEWSTRRVSRFVHLPGHWHWGVSRLLRQKYWRQREAEVRTLRPENGYLGGFTVLETLLTAKELHLTDPSDRLYAFSALPFVGMHMPALWPKYEQSYLETYKNFAVEYLDKTSDLDILMQVNHTSQTLGNFQISSWIPRWDYKGWHEGSKPSRNDAKFDCESANSSKCVVRRNKEGNFPSLQVRGVILDSVKFISKTISHELTVEEVCALWLQFPKSSQFSSGQDDPDISCLRLAFLQALSAGFWGASSYQEWSDSLKEYASLLPNGSPGDSQHANGRPMSDRVQQVHVFSTKIAHRARLFTLEQGYYGLGPGAAEKGDVYALIFGVSKPVILRRVPEENERTYWLIGPAYVVSKELDQHGIPYGFNLHSLWRDWEEFRKCEGWAGLEAEDIVLV